MRQTTQTTIAENGIQRNITKAEADERYDFNSYDLIIKTQEEFDEWLANITEYKTVAILSGTYNIDKIQRNGYQINFNVELIHGIGMPKIIANIDANSKNLFNCASNAACTIENLQITVHGGDGFSSIRVLNNFYKVSNVVINFENSVMSYGFRNCIHVSDCQVIANNTVFSGICYNSCGLLNNCTVNVEQITDSTANDVSVTGFNYCTFVLNCDISIVAKQCMGINNSDGIINCFVVISSTIDNSVLRGFYNSKFLTNCQVGIASEITDVSNQVVYGFYNCTKISNCNVDARFKVTKNMGWAYYSCSWLNGCEYNPGYITGYGGGIMYKDDSSCTA